MHLIGQGGYQNDEWPGHLAGFGCLLIYKDATENVKMAIVEH